MPTEIKKIKIRASIETLLQLAAESTPMIGMYAQIAHNALVKITERAIELDDKVLLEHLHTLDLVEEA